MMAMLGRDIREKKEDDFFSETIVMGDNPMFIGFSNHYSRSDSMSRSGDSFLLTSLSSSLSLRPKGHRLSSEKWAQMKLFTKTIRKACCVWEGKPGVDAADTYDLFKRFQASNFENPIVLSGTIMRQSKFRKRWQPRFLRVNIVEGTLSYSRSQNKYAKAKATIALSTLIEVKVDEFDTRRFVLHFDGSAPKRPLVFQTNNEEECQFYIRKFKPLIEFVHYFEKRTQFPLQVRQTMQRPVNYRIGKLVYSGQFATVHEAVNIAPAVKNFKVRIAQKFTMTCADDVHHLNGMARVLSALSEHVCVVRLVDTFMTSDHYYIVTEIIRGGTLARFIYDQSHGYSEMFVKQVMAQLLQAIEFMHHLKIVHLDLTLNHLLLSATTQGVPQASSGIPSGFYIKLAGFQFAKTIEDGAPLPTHVPQPQSAPKMLDSCFNRHRATNGQLAEYVAPELQGMTLIERIRFDGPDIHKIDIFAAGVIFFTLLFGRHPWGDKHDEISDRIKTGQFLFPDEPLADAGTACRSFLEKMLCVNPRDRPTAAVLLDHPWMKADLCTRNVLGGWRNLLPNFNL